MAPTTFDRKRTAIVIMDFQNDIVKLATDPAAVLKGAKAALAGARLAGLPVIHIRHRGGAYAADTPGTQIHADMTPAPGETVFFKTKHGAFSTTGLDAHLRENGIDTLALMGVSTSGCVLSTVRWGFDTGYRLVVVSDGCRDREDDIHDLLMAKVFPKQASVLTGAQFLAALA